MKTQLIIPSLQQIVNFFREETIDEIAKETGFSVRKRQLSALVFLGLFTFGLIQKADSTLVQLVSLAKRILPSLRITPQGLHKRINTKAVAFLKKMFAKSLTLTIDREENLVPLLSSFEKVQLLDSSQILLPQEVSHLFAGSGGSRSQAGAKIQLMIDYKTGNFSQLWLTDASSSDQKQMPSALRQIQACELWIFDLGYFSQEALATIDDNEAFFLCRLLIQTALYTLSESGEYKRIHLSEIQKPKSISQVLEVEIYLGAKAKVPCRLIIQPIPEIEINKRKRKLKANAKKKGRTVSDKQLALCAWSFYLTNVKKEMFPAHVVRQVYSLRWQIELVFKAIKSHLGFELILGKREERILSQLYGRLIVLVFSLFLTGQLSQQLWRSHQRELSLLKSFAHLPVVAPQILAQLRHPMELLRTFFQVAEEMMTLCRMDKRKKRLSTAETLRAITV